jgi:PAT family beta-lactamase induction signal transducer AmpG
MLDISKHPYLKYILFGNLYFAEGLIFALSTVVIVLYFTEKDISIATTTLVAGISALPWVLKFIFGPTVDFFGKYGRKFFIFVGGIIGIVSIFIVAFIDPSTSLIPFTIIFFIGHSGVVLLDVAADAWAIQISKTEERGKVNASMFIGLFGGTAIGGILLAYIATYYGFEMVFITTSLLIILSIILPLYTKEHRIKIERKKIKPLLIKEFKKRNTQIVALFDFVSALNFGMLMFVIPEYMTNVLLLDKLQIGLLNAAYPISIVIGASFGGAISDKIGRKKILFITLAGLLISAGMLVTADSWEKLAIIYTFIGILTGASTYSVTAALLMDITNPKVGGAQYSFLASIANFGEIGIGMISGALVVALGYQRYFLYIALTIGASIFVLYFVKETIVKKKG